MKRSYVYFNLQRRVWSERQAGKVIGHPEVIRLRDVRFLVGKAGQAKVRAEGRKNVHAGISGLDSTPAVWRRASDGGHFPVDAVVDQLMERGYAEVSYNPYRNDSFVRLGGQYGPQPVTQAERVAMFAPAGDLSEVAYSRPLVLALGAR